MIRERIITAFESLLPEKGLYKTTVDEIASAAGLSKRTIYRYFQSKDEIIESTLNSFMEKMGRGIEELIQKDLKPEDILDELFNRLFKHVTKIFNPKVMNDLQTHYPQYWVKIDQYRTEKARELLMSILEKSNQGKERKLEPTIISAIIIASVQNILNPKFLLKNDLPFEETAKQLIDFFQYGLFKQDEI